MLDKAGKNKPLHLQLKERFWKRKMVAKIHPLKTNNKNIRKRCEVSSKFPRKTPEGRQ